MFKQFLIRSLNVVTLNEIQNVFLDFLLAQIVKIHEGSIRLKRAWNRDQRCNQNDGTVLHLAPYDALGEISQT